MIQTVARNATLQDAADILRTQQAHKIDLVVPATQMRAECGNIVITGVEPVVDDSGVTMADGVYRPTALFDSGVSSALKIPLAYVRYMREQRPDLYDANVNLLLHGGRARSERDMLPMDVEFAPDPRNFFFRGFTGDDPTEPGIARSLLSDRYGQVDHLDVLTAALAGVRESGVEVNVDRVDLTESRLYVVVSAPSVAALAPQLLDGYRSPFSGATGADNPTVFAGFVVSNSETGQGAASITPRLVVQVCSNGMTITKDVMRAVHLGVRLEPGIVRWSQDTQRKNLDVVTAKARDAVATFLDVDYVARKIAELETAAGVKVRGAQKTVEFVGTQLGFSQEHIDGVLDHFIKGGQMTAGGVMQAVTSYAQTVEDPDAAYDMEAKAVQAMELVPVAARLR